MSSPATSCSRRYTDSASTYCSRKRLMTMASRNDLMPRFSVYQLGRGSDPVIVVGRIVPAVALIIWLLLPTQRKAQILSFRWRPRAEGAPIDAEPSGRGRAGAAREWLESALLFPL